MRIAGLRPSAACLIALFALGLVGPLFVYPVFLMKVLCFALFASAYNLLVGYVGLLAFGHAMFFGGSAYITGYLLRDVGVTPELSILAGVAVSAVLGFVVGALSIGRQGIYFAMITLALAQMFYFFCVQAPFTGGENGITAIPPGQLLGLIDLRDDVNMYYFVLAVVSAAIFLLYRTIHSPFGQVLKGIRDNENRAISLGYDVTRFKLIAFVLSASITGLAGSLKVIVLQLATLVDVSWIISGEVILMTLIGGIGTVVGPIIGAAVIITLQNYLTGLAEWVVTVQGVIFFFTVLLFRRGIVGEIEHFFRQRRSGKASRRKAPAPRTEAVSVSKADA
jgi:branched-chain amino acid transport system permease protein